MALISCPECGREISSAAPACPGCGAPIATAQSMQTIGVPVTTMQETSKRLKGHTVLASLMVGVGVLWGSASSPTSADHWLSSVGPTLMILGGLVWYLVTKVRVWWHHR